MESFPLLPSCAAFASPAYLFPSVTRKSGKQTSGHVPSPCICGTCANTYTHVHLLSPLLAAGLVSVGLGPWTFQRETPTPV